MPAARLALLALVLMSSSTARASGSVSLDVADERCLLSIRQTFRKIVDGDHLAEYVADVRTEFAGRAAKLLPVVDRVLARRKLPLYDLALPVIMLRPIPLGPAEREELVVGVRLAGNPEALRAEIAEVVAAAWNEAQPGDLAALEPVEKKGASFTVRVHTELRARPAVRARHQERLVALRAAIAGRMASVVEMVPCTRALEPITLTHSDEATWRSVTFCLEKKRPDAALDRKIHDHLASPSS
jgi:hypothetical protein